MGLVGAARSGIDVDRHAGLGTARHRAGPRRRAAARLAGPTRAAVVADLVALDLDALPAAVSGSGGVSAAPPDLEVLAEVLAELVAIALVGVVVAERVTGVPRSTASRSCRRPRE